jgi:hypothetical protein
MPKIKIQLNEYGQLVGEASRKLSSAIGCVVRKTLSVGCDDWRLVDPQKKLLYMKYMNAWDIYINKQHSTRMSVQTCSFYDIDAAAQKCIYIHVC